MPLLIASIAALFLGPLLYPFLSRRAEVRAAMDGFIFVAISGMVFLSVLPEAISNGGLWAIPFAAAGLIGPTLLERLHHETQRSTHRAAIALGLAALVIHALADGAALTGAGRPSAAVDLLALAIVLHRFPVGLSIWWLLRPESGAGLRVLVLGLLTAGTVVGFSAAGWIASGLSSDGMAWFQAFVGGSLLHVVFHRPYARHQAHPGPAARRFEGAGALLGIAMLLLLAASHSHPARDGGAHIAQTFFSLAMESAPALLLAYLMTGLITAFVPASSIGWTRRGTRAGQALRGMAVGLPIPICSCGVVPLYRSLVRRGAPATAAMAFLIATPELGLDAILISIPLLGTEMTILRVASATLAAFFVGWLVGRWTLRAEKGRGQSLPVVGEAPPASTPPLGRRLMRGLKEGTFESVDHTLPWILLGLAVAAFAEPLLTGSWITRLPPAVEILAFALLGLPTYVCASGATPLVAVLLAQGVSPGAALAFLLTGPATNVTTFGVLARLHGRRVSLVFSMAMVGVSVLLGLAANQILPSVSPPALGSAHSEVYSAIQAVSLAALAALGIASLLRRGAREFAGEVFDGLVPPEPHAH